MTLDSSFSLIHRTLGPQSGEPPYPGLLLLHGRGSSETDLLELGPALDSRLFVVSARAPFQFGPGAYYWYDLEASLAGRPSKESIEHSLELVRLLMGQSVEAYSLDPGRFYVGGFSMGAAMSLSALLMYPDLVAGAVALSGYLPIYSNLAWRSADVAGKFIFQAHGTLDDVLPIQFARMTRDYLSEFPISLEYHEYPTGHMVGPQESHDAASWMQARLDGDRS